MYKSRLWLWFMIALLWVFIFFLGPKVKQYIEEQPTYPKEATVASEDSDIRRLLFNRKISGSELSIVSSNANIKITQGITTTEGYKQVHFYSPIVAIMNNNTADKLFRDIATNERRYVRAMNLKEVINGFLDEKPFDEFYTMANTGGCLEHEIPDLYVDEKYENEIKSTFIIALSGHLNITEEDVNQYGVIANSVWEKATKLSDITDFLNREVDNAIVIAPEYRVTANPNRLEQLTFTNTVVVQYTVEYQDNFEYLVNDDSLMTYLGMRRENVTKYIDTKALSYSDWTIAYIKDTDVEQFAEIFNELLIQTKDLQEQTLNNMKNIISGKNQPTSTIDSESAAIDESIVLSNSETVPIIDTQTAIDCLLEETKIAENTEEDNTLEIEESNNEESEEQTTEESNDTTEEAEIIETTKVIPEETQNNHSCLKTFILIFLGCCGLYLLCSFIYYCA